MAVIVEPGAAASVSPSEDEILGYTSTVKRTMELAVMIGRTCQGTSTFPPPDPDSTEIDNTCTGEVADSDEISLEGSDAEFALEENGTACVTMNIESLDLHGSDEEMDSDVLMQLLEGEDHTPVDSMVDLMVELAEVMVTLKDTFSKFTRAEQKVLVDKTFSLTQPLEEFYALAFNLYECKYVHTCT